MISERNYLQGDLYGLDDLLDDFDDSGDVND